MGTSKKSLSNYPYSNIKFQNIQELILTLGDQRIVIELNKFHELPKEYVGFEIKEKNGKKHNGFFEHAPFVKTIVDYLTKVYLPK
jgi:hypothetical protein